MTATATRTRTPADAASWGTWKDHGHAAVLGYMGRDRKSAGMVVRTVKVTVGRGKPFNEVSTTSLPLPPI